MKKGVNRFLVFLVAIALLVSSFGCSARQVGQFVTVAAAVGAGAALGHGKGGAALVLGAASLMGAMITENEWRKEDAMRANAVLENSTSGEVTRWVNPDTGGQYAVTPGEAFVPTRQVPVYAQPQPAAHRPVCRSATVEAQINGMRELVHTVACRNAYGEWEMQQNMQPTS